MSSNLTGLPPSVLAQLSARNVGQEIAVRLISLPDTLKSADAPTKIAGTVAGQLPNGSLQVQTERGIVTMLLKDRGSLPQGQQIEIEIPAGRNPQQASIRTAAPPQPQQSPQSPYGPPPSLPQTIHASPIAPALRIDRTSPIIPADVQAAIGESSPLEDASLLQGKSLPALQPGLSLRLSPLPGGQQEIAPFLSAAGSGTASAASTALLLLEALGQTLPQTQRAAISSLLSGALNSLLSSLPQDSPEAKELTSLIQKIALPIDSEESQQIITLAKNTIQSALNKMGEHPTPIPPPLPSSPSTTPIPAPLAGGAGGAGNFLSATRPLDVQVLSFFLTQGTMTTATTTSSPPNAALPMLSLPLANGQTVILGQTPPVFSSVVTGQVVGFTPQNLPIVAVHLSQEPQGAPSLYILPAATFPGSQNLAVGSPILFSPLGTIDPSLSSAALPTTTTLIPTALPFGASLFQPGTWDSLQDLMHAISQVNPTLAQGLAQNLLPSPAQPQTMGALALFFLSVLRSGDVDAWIPPAVTGLLRAGGRGDILRAVSSDLTLAAKAEVLPLTQDWRSAVIPMLWNNQVYKLPLYYKQMKDDSDPGKDRRNRLLRFLFELRLSRMGDVQVDGFMQKERLDMILRTKSPLSIPMQSTMKQLYTKAVEKSHLTGELAFQFKPDQWVDIAATEAGMEIRA